MTEKTDGPTVYYDGACALCRIEIDYYARQKGAEAITFCDVSDSAAPDLPDLPRQAALRRFHVRNPDGSLVSGAAGFATLWQHLPGWARAGRIMALPGILPLMELAYRGFLPIRPTLSRGLRRWQAWRKPRALPRDRP